MKCPSRFGFSQRCQMNAGHPGDHDSGRIRWTDRESATSTHSIAETLGGRTE